MRPQSVKLVGSPNSNAADRDAAQVALQRVVRTDSFAVAWNCHIADRPSDHDSLDGDRYQRPSSFGGRSLYRRTTYPDLRATRQTFSADFPLSPQSSVRAESMQEDIRGISEVVTDVRGQAAFGGRVNSTSMPPDGFSSCSSLDLDAEYVEASEFSPLSADPIQWQSPVTVTQWQRPESVEAGTRYSPRQALATLARTVSSKAGDDSPESKGTYSINESENVALERLESPKSTVRTSGDSSGVITVHSSNVRTLESVSTRSSNTRATSHSGDHSTRSALVRANVRLLCDMPQKLDTVDEVTLPKEVFLRLLSLAGKDGQTWDETLATVLGSRSAHPSATAKRTPATGSSGEHAPSVSHGRETFARSTHCEKKTVASSATLTDYAAIIRNRGSPTSPTDKKDVRNLAIAAVMRSHGSVEISRARSSGPSMASLDSSGSSRQSTMMELAGPRVRGNLASFWKSQAQEKQEKREPTEEPQF